MESEIMHTHNLTNGQKVKVTKALIVIVCLLGFTMNSYFIFDNYAKGKTIISTDLQPAENNMLSSPSILICGKMSFEKTELNMNSSDYIENSLKLDEFLGFAMLLDGKTLDAELKNVTDQFRPFYTIYYGTCHLLDLNVMVNFNQF